MNTIPNIPDLERKDPREKVSKHLRGPQRLEGEDFKTYQLRRKREDVFTKMYLRGYYI